MHQSKFAKPVILAVFLIVLVAAVPLGSVHASSPPKLVSGPSPFASCTIGGPGTNYVNAEVEPRVAVNPTDPSNIVGVVRDGHGANAVRAGLVAGVTHDGAATWSET